MQKQPDAVYRTAQGWDIFSDKYAKQYQKNTSVFCMTLLNMLQIEEADCILDAGCGAGFLHQHLVNQKKPNSHLYAFDISPLMVQRAAARMKRYLKHEQIGALDQLTKEEIENVSLNDEIFNKVNYHLSIGNVEDLAQYNNEMFDVFVCNLVYQIISNQPKALSEAFRVLKPGGKIGFTVWGNRANCAALWFIKECAYKAGLYPEGVTGNFLTSSEQPIQLAKDAGFVNILCWEQMNPFDILSSETVHHFFHPELEELLAKTEEEKRKTFYSEIEKMMTEYHNKHLPFPFDCYLLIAEKPKQ